MFAAGWRAGLPLRALLAAAQPPVPGLWQPHPRPHHARLAVARPRPRPAQRHAPPLPRAPAPPPAPAQAALPWPPAAPQLHYPHLGWKFWLFANPYLLKPKIWLSVSKFHGAVKFCLHNSENDLDCKTASLICGEIGITTLCLLFSLGWGSGTAVLRARCPPSPATTPAPDPHHRNNRSRHVSHVLQCMESSILEGFYLFVHIVLLHFHNVF